jgi:hypothetical protein
VLAQYDLEGDRDAVRASVQTRRGAERLRESSEPDRARLRGVRERGTSGIPSVQRTTAADERQSVES